MPWNPNIPQPADLLSQSQGELLDNFQAIDAWFDVNHVNPTDGGNQGKHNYVTFPNAVVAVPPGTPGEVTLYTADLGGTRELFIQNSDGESTPITAGIKADPGFAYLPSGHLMKWGSVQVNHNNRNTLALNFAGSPAFTTIFTIMLGGGGGSGFTDPVYIEDYAPNFVTVYNADRTNTYVFITVIGE